MKKLLPFIASSAFACRPMPTEMYQGCSPQTQEVLEGSHEVLLGNITGFRYFMAQLGVEIDIDEDQIVKWVNGFNTEDPKVMIACNNSEEDIFMGVKKATAYTYKKSGKHVIFYNDFDTENSAPVVREECIELYETYSTYPGDPDEVDLDSLMPFQIENLKNYYECQYDNAGTTFHELIHIGKKENNEPDHHTRKARSQVFDLRDAAMNGDYDEAEITGEKLEIVGCSSSTIALRFAEAEVDEIYQGSAMFEIHGHHQLCRFE